MKTTVIKGHGYVIEHLAGVLTDDGKAKRLSYLGANLGNNFKNKEQIRKRYVQKFRLKDDDGLIYAYGWKLPFGYGDGDFDFAPLDDFMYDWGVTSLEYLNSEGGWDIL